MVGFSNKEAKLLLHNKFVAILGDSIQRSVYKDLVVVLQKNAYASNKQLKSKGELNFEHDFLVEGGVLGEQTNGTGYREVRQYRTDHHLVRFYFLTRVYSKYVESVLLDFQAGPQPDVLIINSCIWDISRYGREPMEDYKNNLEKLFTRLDEILLPECLVIWNMAMPLGKKISGGFLIPELQHLDQTLRFDVIAANFYSATMADSYKFDVLDLHYHFRFELQNRVKDGIHWNPIAHRQISNLLLSHIAEAWSVEVPSVKPIEGPVWNENSRYQRHGRPFLQLTTPPSLLRNPTPSPSRGTESRFYNEFCAAPGFISFESQSRQEGSSRYSDRTVEMFHNFGGFTDFSSSPNAGYFSQYAPLPLPSFMAARSNDLVMRRHPMRVRDNFPYSRPLGPAYRTNY
ncbi:PC-esterase domain-containing protein 1A-like [Latimeria chalumnae]|nr:PREDICTED: PC-esterase domain-containing protein 1A-like isoform X2 [Latimeria chalumnae]XP_014354236.1 PREDICTED: PC-esterase domain-containing protein 1A-like isoform X2 [Latimeria chalumnae]|eukprot:XP_014354235.1 PREDICTED: PC-esterase domain-containing protein 1A-like isoform X2 [Latimeria chalumnae]